VTFRERIRVNGKMISEEAVADGLSTIRNLITNWEPHPTFFEVTTALAIKHFDDAARNGGKRSSAQLPSPSPLPSTRGERIKVRGGSPDRDKVDIVILETGIGGRLDATNAIQSDVSVITQIDFDHQEWLGNALAEIASEKAGIIKPGVPVVCGVQRPGAERVIRARAAECEAPLHIITNPYDKSLVSLRGEHQKFNAALAVAALKLDCFKQSSSANAKPRREREPRIETDDAAIARGLARIDWPARFQMSDERTIIDGAHNPAAARVLVETWREVFGDRKATLILAVLSDKDLRGICEALVPIADSVLLPRIRSERAAQPETLAKVFVSISSNCRAGASPAGNPESIRGCPTISITASIGEALDLARSKPNPILITGSLHFAGEVLAHLRGEPAAFEECAQ
jgi:dihydrofolate synthase/folylpolyglutamate synthase